MNRVQLRNRHADVVATSRKNRRNAERKQFTDGQTHDTILGMARVYFRGAGTPAMQANVRRAVHRLAVERRDETGTDYTTALQAVEGRMLEVLEASNA